MKVAEIEDSKRVGRLTISQVYGGMINWFRK